MEWIKCEKFMSLSEEISKYLVDEQGEFLDDFYIQKFSVGWLKDFHRRLVKEEVDAGLIIADLTSELDYCQEELRRATSEDLYD
jgi:hypothetical protein